MKYKIVVDSCCDLPDDLYNNGIFERVSLTLHLDGQDFVDNETFNQLEFIDLVAKSPNCAKSSCPSPEDYMNAFKGEATDVYVVTLSGNLSGSYNSAMLAKKLYEEEYGTDKNIHVVDSCSASCGEAAIAFKLQELAEEGLEFNKIVEAIEKFRDDMGTYFVIETLDALRKNGRLTNLQAIIASALNIKPVMGANPDGTICKLDQARGIDKALKKMVQIVIDKTTNVHEKMLVISHCNCKERAEQVKAEFEKVSSFKKILITNTHGISTLYASDGGIIVSV